MSNDIQEIEETATYTFLFFFALLGGLLMAIFINIVLGLFLIVFGFLSAYSIYYKLKKGWYFGKRIMRGGSK